MVAHHFPFPCQLHPSPQIYSFENKVSEAVELPNHIQGGMCLSFESIVVLIVPSQPDHFPHFDRTMDSVTIALTGNFLLFQTFEFYYLLRQTFFFFLLFFDSSQTIFLGVAFLQEKMYFTVYFTVISFL